MVNRLSCRTSTSPIRSYGDAMTRPFPDLTEEWFKEHGSAPDHVAAARAWNRWLASRPQWSDETKHGRALQLASGLSAASISHYLNGGRRSSATRRGASWTA